MKCGAPAIGGSNHSIHFMSTSLQVRPAKSLSSKGAIQHVEQRLNNLSSQWLGACPPQPHSPLESGAPHGGRVGGIREDQVQSVAMKSYNF